MALPNAFTAVTSRDIYPDLIQILLRIPCPSDVSFAQLAALLFQEGVRPSRYGNRLSGEFDTEGTCTYTFRINRPYRSAPLNVYVDVNPLLLLRERHVDFGDEHSLGSGDNWVHPNSVSNRSTLIWEFADYAVRYATTQIQNILERGLRRRMPGISAVAQNIRVMKIEMVVDFHSSDPSAHFEAVRIPFARHLGGNEALYRRANIIQGMRHDGRMIFGNRTADERYKVYVKTNRRIRFECRLGRRAIANLRLGRDFADPDNSFVRFISDIADHVRLHFNRVLLDAEQNTPTDQLSVVEFLSHFCTGFTNREIMTAMLSTLIHTERLRSTQNRSAIARLMQAGVLVQSLERGYRTYHPIYTRAIHALQGAIANFSLRGGSRPPPYLP